jgi:ribosomal protein L29
MKAKELKGMSQKKLEELSVMTKKEVMDLKFQFSSGKKDGNVRSLRKKRKDLARILTLIKKKDDGKEIK